MENFSSMPIVITAWTTTRLSLPVLWAALVSCSTGGTSVAVVFPPGISGPWVHYLTKHPPSKWLLLCPPVLHPQPGCRCLRGDIDPFYSLQQTWLPRAGELSCRGVAGPPGRCLRSSAVPTMRSQSWSAFGCCVPPGMHLSVSLCWCCAALYTAMWKSEFTKMSAGSSHPKPCFNSWFVRDGWGVLELYYFYTSFVLKLPL